MGLGQFDAAKECYESLRTFGDKTSADCYLKKLHDAQDRDESKEVLGDFPLTFRLKLRVGLANKCKNQINKSQINLKNKYPKSQKNFCPT